MRKFINLNKSKQEALLKQFPGLQKIIEVEPPDKYTFLAVSVFDHWLSREEARMLLDDVSGAEQKKRNEALYSFSKKLLKETEVINFRMAGKWSHSKPKFRRLTSDDAAFDYFKPAVSETSKRFFNVVIPELGVVFLESWDDTNVMYLLDDSVKPQLEEWAAECGVHCLANGT
ncbi:hypothetical protein [Microbulbifer sp. GL-2]|uniref:hypothetical protein n=1 Tax=Microbulbifer sp. GL-2 TaxID=2591606 RepID=UPI001162C351|nr:hypothetical protein [Microbulbifer sp. GL-2]BBM02533.1 hypothetical protein GL2_26070 [Microbulbifer sp. GL-2]